MKNMFLSGLSVVALMALSGCGGGEPQEGSEALGLVSSEQALGPVSLDCGWSGSQQLYCTGYASGAPSLGWWQYTTPSGSASGWYWSGPTVNWYNCCSAAPGEATRSMTIEFYLDGYSTSTPTPYTCAVGRTC
jgi:hypothetical protein